MLLSSQLLKLLFLCLVLSMSVSCAMASTPAKLTLTGCFCTLLGQHGLTKSRTDRELSAMHQSGIRYVVLHSAANEGDAHYSTQLSWLKCHDRGDRLEWFLSAADRYGIGVFLYTYDTSEYWEDQTDTFYDSFVAKCIAVTDEVYRKYGHHKSLIGFHLSPEFWYPASDELISTWKDHYIKQFTSHVKALDPDLKTTTAPFVGTFIPYSEQYEKYDSTQVRAYWDGLLKDSGIDIIVPQDGIGADEHVARAAQGRSYKFIGTLFSDIDYACKKNGVELWDDVEAFEAVRWGYPPHFSRISRQLDAASPYAKEFIAFEWQYLSPGVSIPAVEFQANLKRHNNGERLLQRISTNRPCRMSMIPTKGKGLSLTSQIQQYRDCVVWETKKPVEVTIDLGYRWRDIIGFALESPKPFADKNAVPKCKVYASDDGKRFEYVTSLDAESGDSVLSKMRHEGVGGRYVKFEIRPAEGHGEIRCSKLAVFGNTSQWIGSGCEYRIDLQPDDRVRDEGWKLTDWDDSRWINSQVGWHRTKQPIHIVLDLKKTKKTDLVQAVFLKSEGDEPTRAKILGGYTANLPHKATVEYSTDGKTFVKAGNPTIHGEGKHASYVFDFHLNGKNAKFVRLTIDPDPSGWTMISELRVLGE